MHEMSVTQGILDLALQHAGGRRITDIYLQVGRMSPVIPDSVQVFFDYLSKDTPAEDARLHFEITPIEMVCQDCQHPADLSPWQNERPQVMMARALAKGCPCGSKRLRVVSGISFGMVSIEVEGARGGEKRRIVCGL